MKLQQNNCSVANSLAPIRHFAEKYTFSDEILKSVA